MTNLLYFATGDGANASGEAYVAPVSKLRGIHPVSSTTLDLIFDSTYGNRDSADYFDYVRLTTSSNSYQTIISRISSAINTSQGSLVVICDSDNSTFIDPSVTDCSIFLNQSTVDSSIIPGVGKQVIAIDQNIRFADSGDNTVIVELSGVKIPAHSFITRAVAVIKTESNLSTMSVNLQMSATSGTAADSAISSGTELLGAGLAYTDSTDSLSTSDISMGSGAADAKKVWIVTNNLTGQHSMWGMLSADHYLYVCNAGTGNGTTNPTAGTLTVIIEYYGID
tara:strand:+ start:1143 stop:1985 length:843 start_codon:yes stop_codon:yes gene_type:complete